MKVKTKNEIKTELKETQSELIKSKKYLKAFEANQFATIETAEQARQILLNKHRATASTQKNVYTIENVFCYRVDACGFWFNYNQKSTPNTKECYKIPHNEVNELIKNLEA